MKTCLRKIELNNSLTIVIYDTTRRYYEDYHLVRLEIECEVAVTEHMLEVPEQLASARKLLGESVRYRRIIEKMGVPFDEIEATRENMIHCFTTTALPYFAAEEFPRKFVLSEVRKNSEKTSRGTV